MFIKSLGGRNQLGIFPMDGPQLSPDWQRLF